MKRARKSFNKKIILTFVMMLCLICLSACGNDTEGNSDTQNEEAVQNETTADEQNPDDEVVKEDHTEDTEDESDAEETEPKGEYAEFPSDYVFCSGTGAWQTSLHLNPDGTFFGTYSDADMGDMGDEYPNGTIYICNFEGKFKDLTAESETVQYMYLDYLNILEMPEESIEDGVRYVASEPYGLVDGDCFYMYYPGTLLSDLPEECRMWIDSYSIDEAERLDVYALCNMKANTVFVENTAIK